MSPETRIAALQMVLDRILEGHTDRSLALTQIDALIAELKGNAKTSLLPQVADPLGRAVEAMRAELKP